MFPLRNHSYAPKTCHTFYQRPVNLTMCFLSLSLDDDRLLPKGVSVCVRYGGFIWDDHYNSLTAFSLMSDVHISILTRAKPYDPHHHESSVLANLYPANIRGRVSLWLMHFVKAQKIWVQFSTPGVTFGKSLSLWASVPIYKRGLT